MPVQCYCRQTGLLEDSEGPISRVDEFSKKGRAFIALPFLHIGHLQKVVSDIQPIMDTGIARYVHIMRRCKQNSFA
ncbi:hypothetical protein J32TS2_40480 [Shouchella clausii]|nr:hypothetical protein J32TS2_40480 [Shouchella clausii]